MKTKGEQVHGLSMRRPDGFYTADNEMIDLAAEIGVTAFAVYHLLKSRAWRADAGVGVREIAAKFRIGKTTAATALKALKTAGLIREVPSTAVNEASSYVVEHAKDVLQARDTGRVILCPPSRTPAYLRRDASVPVAGHLIRKKKKDRRQLPPLPPLPPKGGHRQKHRSRLERHGLDGKRLVSVRLGSVLP